MALKIISSSAAEELDLLSDVAEGLPVRPTIFIGLGGTGGEILVRLRRKFFEQTLSARHDNVRYIYIDLDQGFADKALSDEKSRPVKAHIKFEPNEILKIKMGQDLFEQMRAFPAKFEHIIKWLPQGMAGRYADGAHGNRPIGRLAFFLNLHRIETLVTGAYNDIMRPRETRFVVIASLAGGTGSGLFLDLGFWLRQTYKSDAEIHGIFVMPDAFTDFVEDGERMDANSYAALKELEFYHERKDCGFGVAGQVGDSKHDFAVPWHAPVPGTVPPKPIPAPAYNRVHLISGKNGKIIIATPEYLKSLYEMIAEYLFWDLGLSAFSSSLRTVRDNVYKAAADSVVRADYPGEDGTLKTGFTEYFSARYMTAGVAKICFPVTRVRYLCAYRLSEELLGYWMRPVDIPNVPGRAEELLTNDLKLSSRALRQDLAMDTSSADSVGLIDKISRNKAQQERGLAAAVEQGLSRKQLDTLIANILKDVRGTQNKPSSAASQIQYNQPRLYKTWTDRFRKWVDDLLLEQSYSPASAQAVMGGIATILEQTAAKEEKQHKASFALAERQAESRARTLGFYEDVLTAWRMHPFRNKTLVTLARRALNGAMQEARLRINGYTHQACAKLLLDLAGGQQKLQGKLKTFRAKLADEKSMIEKDRNRLDQMTADHFFEVDLYEQGAYKDFFHLDGKPVGDQTAALSEEFFSKAEFLPEGKRNMQGLVNGICSEAIKGLGDELFAFGRMKFHSSLPAKDVVEMFTKKFPKWTDELAALRESGGSWIRIGGFPEAATKVRKAVGVGWPSLADTGHPLRQHIINLNDGPRNLFFEDCDDAGTVIILEEKTKFPLTAIVGITDWKEHYTKVRMAKEVISPLHLHPDFEDFPDLIAKPDHQAIQEILCRRLILQATVLGIIERSAPTDGHSQGISLTFHYTDRGIPIARKLPKDRFLQALMNDKELRTQLQQSVDNLAKSFSHELQKKLLQILKVYVEDTFPAAVIRDANDNPSSYAAINRSAVLRWYQSLYDTLSASCPKEEVNALVGFEGTGRIEPFAKDLGGGYWVFRDGEVPAQ